jgi:hypothetical protein
MFHPVLKQLSGDGRWAARIRFYKGKTVIHFLSRGLVAVPHATIKDRNGIPILKDIETAIKDNNLAFEINIQRIPLNTMSIMSPELDDNKRNVIIHNLRPGYARIDINLEGIEIYAVAQPEQSEN